MAAIIDEGKNSYHDYVLTKADGVTPVESVEALKYTVSDGTTVLIPWTDIPLTPSGTIEVSGPINRITGDKKKRYLTLFAIHDGGKHLPQEIVYSLKNQIGITPDTEPKT